VDPQKFLSFQGPRFRRAKGDATRLLTEVAGRRSLVGDAEIGEAYRKAEDARKRVFAEMRKDVLAAEELGQSRESIRRTLKAAGVSEDDVADLTSGRYRPLEITADFLKETGLAPEEKRKRREAARAASKSGS
jgi:prophage tail gpP-like protein